MSHDPEIDYLMEQIECPTITRDNMEGRLSGWLVKYAAMKDDRDTWQKRAEFSYQERNKLEKQRDDLLAALEQFLDPEDNPPEDTGEWREALRVIASVKGGRCVMNRASPADLRKAIAVANAYVKTGILFVPMPVFSKEEQAARVEEAANILDRAVIDELKGGAA